MVTSPSSKNTGIAIHSSAFTIKTGWFTREKYPVFVWTTRISSLNMQVGKQLTVIVSYLWFSLRGWRFNFLKTNYLSLSNKLHIKRQLIKRPHFTQPKVKLKQWGGLHTWHWFRKREGNKGIETGKAEFETFKMVFPFHPISPSYLDTYANRD